MVRADYAVEYYESEEAYEQKAKPKGAMYLEGYEVVRDPNVRKVQAKEELHKKFGIEGGVEYTKYEPLTLEIFHPIRRRWLMRFTSQEEFDSWAKMFDQVVLRARSRTLRDPIAARAFQSTFEALRTPLDVPSNMVGGRDDECRGWLQACGETWAAMYCQGCHLLLSFFSSHRII